MDKFQWLVIQNALEHLKEDELIEAIESLNSGDYITLSKKVRSALNEQGSPRENIISEVIDEIETIISDRAESIVLMIDLMLEPKKAEIIHLTQDVKVLTEKREKFQALILTKN